MLENPFSDNSENKDTQKGGGPMLGPQGSSWPKEQPQDNFWRDFLAGLPLVDNSATETLPSLYSHLPEIPFGDIPGKKWPHGDGPGSLLAPAFPSPPKEQVQMLVAKRIFKSWFQAKEVMLQTKPSLVLSPPDIPLFSVPGKVDSQGNGPGTPLEPTFHSPPKERTQVFGKANFTSLFHQAEEVMLVSKRSLVPSPPENPLFSAPEKVDSQRNGQGSLPAQTFLSPPKEQTQVFFSKANFTSLFHQAEEVMLESKQSLVPRMPENPLHEFVEKKITQKGQIGPMLHQNGCFSHEEQPTDIFGKGMLDSSSQFGIDSSGGKHKSSPFMSSNPFGFIPDENET